MEIAAYPVPYIPPPTPQVVDVKPANGAKSDLQSRNSHTGSPSERVLQGEVLGNAKKQSNTSSSDRYTFEQRARREKPDLSGLSAEAQTAIRSYLDNADISSFGYHTRPLIDVYV